MIGIIHGGYSTEKDVSTRNAQYVAVALENKGYGFKLLEYDQYLPQKLTDQDIDFVFLCVQGKGHGDGTLQGLLDFMSIPYTGSGLAAASVINNKIICKELFEYHGIPTAKWMPLSIDDYRKGNYNLSDFGFPIVAKAPSQGGSFGITMVRDESEASNMEMSFRYDDTILLERFVPGTFVTVGLLQKGDELIALPCVEGVDEREKRDELALFTGEYGVVASDIPDEIQLRLQKYALKVFRAFGASDYARVDFIVNDSHDRFDALEINAVPGLKPKSLYPNAASLAGIEYDELIETILLSARRRAKR